MLVYRHSIENIVNIHVNDIKCGPKNSGGLEMKKRG